MEDVDQNVRHSSASEGEASHARPIIQQGRKGLIATAVGLVRGQANLSGGGIITSAVGTSKEPSAIASAGSKMELVPKNDPLLKLLETTVGAEGMSGDHMKFSSQMYADGKITEEDWLKHKENETIIGAAIAEQLNEEKTGGSSDLGDSVNSQIAPMVDESEKSVAVAAASIDPRDPKYKEPSRTQLRERKEWIEGTIYEQKAIIDPRDFTLVNCTW